LLFQDNNGSANAPEYYVLLSILILRDTVPSTSCSLSTRPRWTLNFCTELRQLRKHPLLLRYEDQKFVAALYSQKYAVAD